MGTLLRVLLKNDFQVHPHRLHRLAFLVFTGLANSLFKLFEDRCNGYKLECTKIKDPPIFILGHWRSGTTHLHNLLSLDDRFHCPNVYQCLFPHHFIYTQKNGARMLERLCPPNRPMDNMVLSMYTPHEDEFALAALSGVSPYINWLFPQRTNGSLAVLDPQKLDPQDLERWKNAFMYFLKALSFSKGRRIVFKSPPHCGRVAALLELTPRAKFIHIHRNPYEVFLSSQKMWRYGAGPTHLQAPDPGLIEETILSWYEELFLLLERDRKLVSPENYTEIRFEDLEKFPRQTLEKIYEDLGLEDFGPFWLNASSYLDSLKDYQKNSFELDAGTRKMVSRRWRESFTRYGYPI